VTNGLEARKATAVFSKILVPVDGSEQSKTAVALAIRVAGERTGKLVFLNVVDTKGVLDPFARPDGTHPTEVLAALQQDGREALRAAQNQAAKAGVPSEIKQVEGETIPSILDLAHSDGFELIAIGSHGRSGVSRALLGSVAEAVMRKARCPVLVTHTKKPA
jgi:nucleotide-binding universal stress UspA family protein